MQRVQQTGKRRPAAVVTLALLVSWLASDGASADPRWWWDERPVPFSFGVDLDIDAVSRGRTEEPVVFLTWVEPASPIEAWVRLSASFDGGCTTCDPAIVLGALGLEDEVALAVLEVPSPVFESRLYSIAVAQASDGLLRIAHGVVEIPEMGTVALKCEQLHFIAWDVTRLADTGASSPDVTAIASPRTGLAHFHATWRQEVPTRESDAMHARDLSGNGGAWETTGALPEPRGGGLDVRDPQVTADLVGDDTRSSVEIVHGDPGSGTILRHRSTDSGATFSGTGDPGPGEPQALNVPGGGSAPVALDTGATSFDDPAWHGVAWLQSIGLSVGIAVDAGFQATPTTTAPPFGTDHLLTGSGFEWDVELALSVQPGGDAGSPTPLLTFWNAPGGEITWRGAVLDAGAAVPVDVDALPFARGRLTDPMLSTNSQLSACTFDEGTGDCLPTRTDGSAREPVTDEAEGTVFVAWLDDRTGRSEVWWTRSDEQVERPSPGLTTECSMTEPGTARIVVEFPPLSSCASAFARTDERIRRYFVYHGTDPGGPYDNVDLDGSDPLVPDTLIVPDDGTLGATVTVAIEGLAPSTAHWVLVVPEDEARNVEPRFFDPLENGPDAFPGEVSITTPSCGAAAPCLFRATADSRDTSGLFSGVRDPVTDVAFAPPFDAAHHCPHEPGDLDPDPVLAPGAPALALYQVEGGDVDALRVSKDEAAESVRIDY